MEPEQLTILYLVAAVVLLVHRYAPWPSVQVSRVGGGFLFGVPPLFFQPPLGLPKLEPALMFLALVAFVVLPIVLLTARKPSHWAAYPLDRRASWDRASELHNAAGWAVYLVGYELFFRGMLLSWPAERIGTWPALAIMTVIYVAAHLPRPAGEAIGTLPMGLLFGIVTLKSGSIWPAVLGHWLIAVASDSGAIRFSRAQGRA